MKTHAALLVCTLVAALPLGAQNLVPNHSFEESDSCWPYTGFYFPEDGPLGWFSGGFTPDYFQECAGSGADNGQPLNYVGFQNPQDGEHYAGIGTYIVEPWPTREYLMIALDSVLAIGQTYYVSFFANVAWNGTSVVPQVWLASNNVGALFTVGSRQWQNGDPLPAIVNHAHVFHPWIIADTVNWTLVSGSFVADSAYQFMMIGNHFDNANTDTVAIGASINPPAAYLFIDNVCVSASQMGCAIAEGIEDPQTNTLQLYPNPAVDHVILTTTKPGSAFASVVLLDASGRSVPVQVERNTAQQLTLRWAQPLAPGVYVVRAALKSGERFTERVVVH